MLLPAWEKLKYVVYRQRGNKNDRKINIYYVMLDKKCALIYYMYI